MKLQDNLVLDHYYFTMSQDEFDELREIFIQFDCTNHSVVKTDAESWEGLYIKTRGRNYLEFLNEKVHGTIGLCQSMFSNPTQDASLIMQELSELPWRTFDRYVDKKLWFTSLSLNVYEELNTECNAWIMKYAFPQTNKLIRLVNTEIELVSEVVVRANPSLREKINFNLQWMKAEKIEKKGSIELNIQTYYLDDFIYKIIFDESVEKFELESIRLRLYEGMKAKAKRLKIFSLLVDGREMLLVRNKIFANQKKSQRIKKTEAIMAKKKATKKAAKKTTKKKAAKKK